jgi:hypothetical protein
MKRRTTLALAAAAMLLAAGAARAHDDATLDASAAPHGGQLRMAGIYHFELVLVGDNRTAKDNRSSSTSPTMRAPRSQAPAPPARQRCSAPRARRRPRCSPMATTD